MKVLQSRMGAGCCLVVSSPSAAVSLWVAAAENKLVVASQSTTVAVTVVSFIFLHPVREAKRGAVGAAPLLVVSAAACSSASAKEVGARVSTVYSVDVFIVLLVLRCLVLLFVKLEDSLVASLAPGAGPQFLNHGQDVPPTAVGHPHFHGLPLAVVVGKLV